MNAFNLSGYKRRGLRAPLYSFFLMTFIIAAAATPADGKPLLDPLNVTIDDRDAARFADLWDKTDGHPSVSQLDSYIAEGGEGITIFTPERIVSGVNLNQQIAAHHDWYEQAVHKCLPWVKQSNGELRSIYLALRGLFPDRQLPQIYMVVGGANSGGTAGSEAQFLGLEILCRDGPTAPQFSAELRTFVAHETTHTFQGSDDDAQASKSEPLLRAILLEGTADYVASLVTGASPNVARDEFGSAHEGEIWQQFLKDRVISNVDFDRVKQKFGQDAQAAFSHWLYNEGRGKIPGWETDMGYWLGMQIAKAYVEHAPAPHVALDELLALRDPAQILRKSGYPNLLGKGTERDVDLRTKIQ